MPPFGHLYYLTKFLVCRSDDMHVLGKNEFEYRMRSDINRFHIGSVIIRYCTLLFLLTLFWGGQQLPEPKLGNIKLKKGEK